MATVNNISNNNIGTLNINVTQNISVESKEKMIIVSGAGSAVCNGQYLFDRRREGTLQNGQKATTDRFISAQGVIFERNVDYNDTTWKMWHPEHNKGYSFYYVVTDAVIPPKHGWVVHKGKASPPTVRYCVVLNQ